MSKKTIKDENGKTYTVKEKKPFYKKWWFWLIIAIIAIAAFGGSESDSSSSDSSAKSEQSSKNSEKSSSKRKKEGSKYKKINDEFAKTLSENQSYAESGNSSFDFAGYISKIEYTGDKKVTVYVYSEFNNLSDEQKKDVLDNVQGLVQLPLLDAKAITNEDCRNGVFLTVNLGNETVGHSKATDYKEYTFYNN